MTAQSRLYIICGVVPILGFLIGVKVSYLPVVVLLEICAGLKSLVIPALGGI
jgi:hypothetical protein